MGETYASAFDHTVSSVLYAHPITLTALLRPENYGYSTPCLEKSVLGNDVWVEIQNFVCTGSEKEKKWAQEWCGYYYENLEQQLCYTMIVSERIDVESSE